MEVLGSTGRVDLGQGSRGQLRMSTAFLACETLLRRKKNNCGRFITVTSAAVRQPTDGLLLSNSVRASVRSALTGLARTLRNEYASYGLSVNNVCLGFTRTARLDSLAKSISTRTNVKLEEVFAGWAREILAGRIGTPEEFAALVAFPASQRAGYMNGTTVAVDGWCGVSSNA
jgi:3-oxoacyl-[acyl-carrier protein] reductase